MQNKLSRVYFIGIILCFLILNIGISSAKDVRVELVNLTEGSMTNVQVSGNYAYGSEDNNLVVLDITDNASPVEVAKLNLTEPYTRIHFKTSLTPFSNTT